MLVSVCVTTAVIGLSSLLADRVLAEGTAESPDRPASDEELVAVSPPPFSEDIFPCSDCHDPTDKVNTTRHEVDFHDNILLKHDEKNRWCLDCHDVRNRDVLHLADGRPVPFTESYRLCGQCHGPQLKNWRAGDHGRRTGYWNGQKEYLLCASCHNPHSPAFKPIKPLPPPSRQENIR
ncbi:MAG: cytochrome c3 family protein [Opitutaceae bacterium]